MGATTTAGRRDPRTVVAQVAGIVALCLALILVGALRAAHDMPMAIALVAMGLAPIPHAVSRAREGLLAGRGRDH